MINLTSLPGGTGSRQRCSILPRASLSGLPPSHQQQLRPRLGREPLAGSPRATHIWLSEKGGERGQKKIPRRHFRLCGMPTLTPGDTTGILREGARCLRCENSQSGWANPGQPRKYARACRKLFGAPWTLWWAQLGWNCSCSLPPLMFSTLVFPPPQFLHLNSSRKPRHCWQHRR